MDKQLFEHTKIYRDIIYRKSEERDVSARQRRGALNIFIIIMKRNPYLDSDDYEGGVNWDPNSNLEEEEFQLPNQSVQNSQPAGSCKKRPSHKNKYINKIILIKPEETANTKKKHPLPNQTTLLPDQLKKIKNREAAKQSRQRKKLYINLIEEQTKALEKELQATNRNIESCKIEIQKSTFNNNQSIGAFDGKIVHVYKKMERLLTMEESQEKDNEINLAIDSMIYRFGASGKERKSNINQSYRQIMSVAPPTIHRYFLWAAKEKAHFFVQDEQQNQENQSWFSDFKKMIGETIEKNKDFIDSKRLEIVKNLEEISKLVGQLRQAKDQIQRFCNLLDNLFMDIREVLTPSQSARLILFIQKYKYREELRFVQSENISDEQPLNSLRKRLKIQGSI